MKSNPFTGRYLFHLHTTYTDGRLTVREYFELAVQNRLNRLIFLEHIRAQPTYEVEQFKAEVLACAASVAVPALVGFEAKVLPGGGIDISPEHLALADVIGVAEHGFPGDLACWRSSIRSALERCAATLGDRHVVWVHPGLWLKRHGLLDVHEQEYRALLRHAQALGVKVERNLRYNLVPEALRSTVRPESLVCGADAHRLTDAEAAIAQFLPELGDM